MSARCSICFVQTTQHLYCHTSVCTPPDCVLSLRSTGRASPCVAQLRPPHECGGFSLAESTCGIPHIHSSLQASAIKSRKKFVIKKMRFTTDGSHPPPTCPHRKVGCPRLRTSYREVRLHRLSEKCALSNRIAHAAPKLTIQRQINQHFGQWFCRFQRTLSVRPDY